MSIARPVQVKLILMRNPGKTVLILAPASSGSSQETSMNWRLQVQGLASPGQLCLPVSVDRFALLMKVSSHSFCACRPALYYFKVSEWCTSPNSSSLCGGSLAEKKDLSICCTSLVTHHGITVYAVERN